MLEVKNLNGGLFGFCVEDVLGVPVEFSTREEKMFEQFCVVTYF